MPILAQQQKIFIKIDNLDGESIDALHKNWIDAYAYSGGLTHSFTYQGGGIVAGKNNFNDYVFTVCLDKSALPMKRNLAMGSHIPTILVEFFKDYNGTSYKYSSISMGDVLITSIIEGTSTDINKTNINVTFNCARVTYSYYSIGKNAPDFIFGWNIAQNTLLP